MFPTLEYDDVDPMDALATILLADSDDEDCNSSASPRTQRLIEELTQRVTTAEGRVARLLDAKRTLTERVERERKDRQVVQRTIEEERAAHARKQAVERANSEKRSAADREAFDAQMLTKQKAFITQLEEQRTKLNEMHTGCERRKRWYKQANKNQHLYVNEGLLPVARLIVRGWETSDSELDELLRPLIAHTNVSATDDAASTLEALQNAYTHCVVHLEIAKQQRQDLVEAFNLEVAKQTMRVEEHQLFWKREEQEEAKDANTRKEASKTLEYAKTQATEGEERATKAKESKEIAAVKDARRSIKRNSVPFQGEPSKVPASPMARPADMFRKTLDRRKADQLLNRMMLAHTGDSGDL